MKDAVVLVLSIDHQCSREILPGSVYAELKILPNMQLWEQELPWFRLVAVQFFLFIP